MALAAVVTMGLVTMRLARVAVAEQVLARLDSLVAGQSSLFDFAAQSRVGSLRLLASSDVLTMVLTNSSDQTARAELVAEFAGQDAFSSVEVLLPDGQPLVVWGEDNEAVDLSGYVARVVGGEPIAYARLGADTDGDRVVTFAPVERGGEVVAVVAGSAGSNRAVLEGYLASIGGVDGLRLTILDDTGLLVATVDPMLAQIVVADPTGSRARTADGEFLVAADQGQVSGWTIVGALPTSVIEAAVADQIRALWVVMGVMAMTVLAGTVWGLRVWKVRERLTRSASAAQERARLLAESSIDMISRHAQDGTYLEVTPSVTGMLGYPPDALLGSDLGDLVHPEDLKRMRTSHRHALAQGESLATFRLRSQSGQWLSVESNARRVVGLAGETDAEIYAITRDVSERQLILEQLEEAASEARAASVMKSEFLANMSHEIRTPLNGVIGMTSLLLDTPLAPDQQEFAQTVSTSANSLLSVINDILDFSRVEAGQLTLESIDFRLATVLDDVLEIVGLQAAVKGLEVAGWFESDVPGWVVGDPSRLRQVLVNLATNAVKFTSSGEVTIVSRLASREGDTLFVRFEVSDTGIGLSEVDRSHVFDSFVQADATPSRVYGGSGLGLAICRQLVELLGGEIGVESELGVGSTFWFTARLEVAVPVARPVVTPRPLAGLEILIVDDNATNRDVMVRFLERAGVAPTAVDGAAAAEVAVAQAAAEGRPFALAVLDYQMPHVDGLELARRLRLEHDSDALKLLLLTSASQRGDAVVSGAVGVDGFFTKPIRRDAFLDALAYILGASKDAADSLITRHTIAEAVRDRKPRVLLAEDNPVNQRLAVLKLERLGYRVEVAGDGQAAVEAARHGGYLAILMDCQMPVMDGYGATRAIRALEPPACEVPVIAMTASATVEDRRRCEEAGMNEFISKPIDWTLAAEVLGQMLDGPKLEAGAGEDERELPAAGAIDVSVLSLIRELGEDEFTTLVGLFLTESERVIREMGAALDAGDDQAVARLCHGLIGSAGSFGANRLATAVAELEALARAGIEGDEAQESWAAVQLEYTAAVTALGVEDQHADA